MTNRKKGIEKCLRNFDYLCNINALIIIWCKNLTCQKAYPLLE